MKVLLDQCKKHSSPVEMPNDLAAILAMAPQMAALCVDQPGKYKNAYAIAHCQVNHIEPRRFFVFANGKVVINPRITERKFPFWHNEGCMSYPFRGMKKVRRWESVTAIWEDEAGNHRIETLRGVMACVMQHEIDHMDGISIYGK